MVVEQANLFHVEATAPVQRDALPYGEAGFAAHVPVPIGRGHCVLQHAVVGHQFAQQLGAVRLERFVEPFDDGPDIRCVSSHGPRLAAASVKHNS